MWKKGRGSNGRTADHNRSWLEERSRESKVYNDDHYKRLVWERTREPKARNDGHAKWWVWARSRSQMLVVVFVTRYRWRKGEV